MYLTRHRTSQGSRWARDGYFLPESLNLSFFLNLPGNVFMDMLSTLITEEKVGDEYELLPPIDHAQEVWASGVTYGRSREARKAESDVGDVYEKVYEATRPELFFKAIGWRVKGHLQPVRIRKDSTWNVPEPELVLVVNRHLEIVGFCAGNDMSSRSIEGENPLYLPQAKMYDGSCALGPGILLQEPDTLRDLRIALTITREERPCFQGEVSVTQMKRSFEELVSYLGQELLFPSGCFLMTGTGIVPSDSFTLQPADVVHIGVGSLQLVNEVQE